jgi:CRISPR-associated protein Cas1
MRIDIASLPRVEDRILFVYLEKGRLERDSNGVQFVNSSGRTPLPVASIATILLGPGTTITHEAMKVTAECACCVIWSGTQGISVYATGMPPNSSNANLLRQARLATDPVASLSVAKKMFEMRFGELPNVASLDELRGMEAIRVKAEYESAARQHGIEWKGRFTEGDWEQIDEPNRCLSIAYSCCYAVCHAAIHSLGLSPSLGFVHAGDPRSFVYDLADLYKVPLCLSIAFESVAKSPGKAESLVRSRFREQAVSAKLFESARSDALLLLGDIEA